MGHTRGDFIQDAMKLCDARRRFTGQRPTVDLETKPSSTMIWVFNQEHDKTLHVVLMPTAFGPDTEVSLACHPAYKIKMAYARPKYVEEVNITCLSCKFHMS